MSDSIDDPEDDAPRPGVPPAPSVMPGPPSRRPPDGAAPPRSRAGCLLVAGAAALVVLVVLGGLVAVLVATGVLGDSAADRAKARRDIVAETGIETSSTDIDHPPQRDIRLGACRSDDTGGLQASGTLTNYTDEPAEYRISLVFLAGTADPAGAELGTTTVVVDAVESLTTTNWSGSVPTGADGPFSCRIATIDRWRVGEAPPDGEGSGS